ncbi:hypothetical protein M433DRAFT_398527 [Acidomyces richmondensis BFW]|nr:MAG: hypothetical protein FE78DRAFT_292789 [Acidomyces sp. 'richmondensis']KYG48684.1 hypothetical protein M433DRAFT_398527 [Acidomyces richmondensis BFW]
MPPRDASIYLISYLPTDRHSTRLIAFDVAISSQYLFDLLIGFLWIHNDVHANRLSARIWVARSLHVHVSAISRGLRVTRIFYGRDMLKGYHDHEILGFQM